MRVKTETPLRIFRYKGKKGPYYITHFDGRFRFVHAVGADDVAIEDVATYGITTKGKAYFGYDGEFVVARDGNVYIGV